MNNDLDQLEYGISDIIQLCDDCINGYYPYQELNISHSTFLKFLKLLNDDEYIMCGSNSKEGKFYNLFLNFDTKRGNKVVFQLGFLTRTVNGYTTYNFDSCGLYYGDMILKREDNEDISSYNFVHVNSGDIVFNFKSNLDCNKIRFNAFDGRKFDEVIRKLSIEDLNNRYNSILEDDNDPKTYVKK